MELTLSFGLIIFIYAIFAYGISNMFVFGSGPFKIFEWIRYLSQKIGPHFGQLFKCMMCFPANLGWVMSLVNWFFLPIAITPGNILLDETNLWYVAMVIDCGFTSGIVWLIHHIEEWFESLSGGDNDDSVDDDGEEYTINADDITLKNN